MLVVQRVAHRVETPLPIGRSDVHAFACGELHTRHDDVNVPRTVRLFVQNGAPCVLVLIQTGEGDTLKIIEHSLNFRIGRRVIQVKSDHRRAVAVHEFEAVNELANLLGIAA